MENKRFSVNDNTLIIHKKGKDYEAIEKHKTYSGVRGPSMKGRGVKTVSERKDTAPVGCLNQKIMDTSIPMKTERLT